MFKHTIIPAVVFSIPAMASASCMAFDRSMHMGDVGDDVKNLQIVLNSNSLTQVSANGAGSPGREMTYFGHATRNAVKRFQALYRAEILGGTARPSGAVGEKTRKKLAVLSCNVTQTVTALEPTTTISDTAAEPAGTSLFADSMPYSHSRHPGATSGQATTSVNVSSSSGATSTSSSLIIADISPKSLHPGSVMHITGRNFTSKNDVLVDNRVIGQMGSLGGTVLNIALPSNIGLGEKEVIVRSTGSELKTNAFAINVTSGGSLSLDHISPNTTHPGASIAIVGEGLNVSIFGNGYPQYDVFTVIIATLDGATVASQSIHGGADHSNNLLTFALPQDIAPGQYTVTVSNSLGEKTSGARLNIQGTAGSINAPSPVVAPTPAVITYPPNLNDAKPHIVRGGDQLFFTGISMSGITSASLTNGLVGEIALTDVGLSSTGVHATVPSGIPNGYYLATVKNAYGSSNGILVSVAN